MVRIAPVRLTYNPKTLWFSAGQLELAPDDDVVVSTARGSEFGHLVGEPFEATDDEVGKLRSSLKPVRRKATDEDRARFEEMDRRSREALPVFKQLAAETVEEMHPVCVEFLLDGERAVFYFEAEERVDFRELVRKLAAEFHVRVDMKQIGVRDEARLIGGYGHCGQELCCRRLGGDFSSISIRMAKEQDLSLNPQKISGVCGRFMCCLRYEYDSYKDFHGRAPKKNAKIETPEGTAKVVSLDMPREQVSVQLEGEKAVKIPLEDFDTPKEGARPSTVGQEAWDRAHVDPRAAILSADNLLTSQLSGEDELADRTRVHRVPDSRKKASQTEGAKKHSRSRSRNRSRNNGADAHSAPQHHARRRRSTTVEADGTVVVSKGGAESTESKQAKPKGGQGTGASRRTRRHRSGSKGQGQKQAKQTQGKTSQNGPGRNSSSLRAGHNGQGSSADNGQKANQGKPNAQHQGTGRKRRRSHKTSGAQGATGANGNAKPDAGGSKKTEE